MNCDAKKMVDSIVNRSAEMAKKRDWKSVTMGITKTRIPYLMPADQIVDALIVEMVSLTAVKNVMMEVEIMMRFLAPAGQIVNALIVEMVCSIIMKVKGVTTAIIILKTDVTSARRNYDSHDPTRHVALQLMGGQPLVALF